MIKWPKYLSEVVLFVDLKGVPALYEGKIIDRCSEIVSNCDFILITDVSKVKSVCLFSKPGFVVFPGDEDCLHGKTNSCIL